MNTSMGTYTTNENTMPHPNAIPYINTDSSLILLLNDAIWSLKFKINIELAIYIMLERKKKIEK